MLIKFINRLKGDKVIWVITLVMLFFSLLSVYSFVPILVKVEGGTPFKYLTKHFIYVIISVIAMLYVLKFPSVFFNKIATFLLIVSAGLLVYTLFFGHKVNGAGRWISIPFVSLTFQASDVAKLAVVLYLGKMLDKKQAVLKSWKEGFFPILLPVILICGLIVKDNFSTAALLFMVAVILMFIGNVPITKLLTTFAVIGLLGASVVLLHKALPDINLLPRYQTWENRLFNRYSDKAVDDENYILNNAQAKNAELGIYSGGVFGQGVGDGKVKEFVPEAYADFYYASFVEEFGFIGAVLLVLLYLILFMRMVRIAMKAEKLYEKITVVGIGIIMMTQALVNMLVCTGVFPVTGQNMPLLAMGGSAMIMTCISISIVQGIAAKYNKLAKAEKTEEVNTKEEDNPLLNEKISMT